jgi:hypothetical protein
MMLHPQNTIATRERRTQEARIAALFAGPRTWYRAGKRALRAVTSFFNRPLGMNLATGTTTRY